MSVNSGDDNVYLSVTAAILAIPCLLIGAVIFSDFLPFSSGYGSNDFQYEQLRLPPAQTPTDIGSTVFIEGGTFMMGAPPDAGGNPLVPGRIWLEMASPAHEVLVDSFEIGKYEVTATEFCKFLNDDDRGGGALRYIFVTGNGTIDYDDEFLPRKGYEWAPAIDVSFEGARRYCEWLSEKTGEQYRLPSEIEWEFAARGTEARTYPWGEESPVGRCYLGAHYLSHHGNRPERPWVATVGTFSEFSTPEGVNDLIGNAEEWCSNRHYDYSATPMSKLLPPDEYVRFLRGEDPVSAAPLANVHASSTSTRGGQYVDNRKHAASTGWTRYTGGLRSLIKRNGCSFRVLKEVD